jgi:hypothetical protein
MKSVYRIVVLACSVVFTAAGVSLGASTLGPPDFALERTWNMMKIALVRVVRVEDGEVVLRTERSYTGEKDTPDESVPLSRMSFGYERRAGSGGRVEKRVEVAVGDELVVWPVRWQPAPIVDGTKVAGPAAGFPLAKTLEEIAKIREAGSEAALKGAFPALTRPFSATRSRGCRRLRRKRATGRSPTSSALCGRMPASRCRSVYR